MSTISERRWPLWSGLLARSLPAPFPPPMAELWSDRDGMHLEEFREDGTLVVRAELPGVDPDRDVEITVAEGTLCIRAERSAHHEQRGDGGFYRSEFRYGQFTRTLALPTGVTAGDVTASYTDGILEVHVPLEEGVEPVNRVEVTRGAESGNGSASGGRGT